MQKATKYIFGVVATVVALLLLWYFRDIVFYIIVAAVLAIVGRPLVNLIKKIKIKNFGVPNWLAALLALVGIVGVLVAFFAIFIPLISGKISDLASLDWNQFLGALDKPIATFQNFLHEYLAIEMTETTVSEMILTQLQKFFNTEQLNVLVSGVVSGVAGAVVGIVSIVFITFFFLKDDTLFLRILLAVTPTKYEGNIKHALGSVSKLLTRYFLGILSESMIMMMLVSISLICCGYGVSNAFFIGLIVGVLNVIPYVGPWLGFGIGLIVSIALTSTGMTIVFIFFSLAITVLAAQAIDNFILQPVLYSNSVSAHPLEIFIVILMAGHVGGVFGMVLAIPGYTVLRVIAKEFFNNFKIVQKLTENIE